MDFKPYGSFTDTIPLAKIPDLLLYWHWDDVKSGDLTWTDRKSGVVLTFSKPLLKDANGLYTGQTATVTCGALPIPGQNAVLMDIFKSVSTSPTTGGAISFGDTTTESAGPAISTNGAMVQAAVGTIAVATLSGPPTGNGKNACRASALTATGATALCVLAHDDGAGALIGSASTNAVGGNMTEFATLALSNSTVSVTSVNGATDDGRRGRIIALFSPSVAMTLNNLKLDCAEAARTWELPARWMRAA